MAYEHILTTRTDRILTLSLNRPEALNAITPRMLTELRDALEAGRFDKGLRAVVLTGSGRAFSAGVDLKALGEVRLDGGSVGDVLDKPARAAIHSIRTVPQPVIAKVNGFCFTGALELALACDLMIAADEAKLGDTHAKWGLRPTWGMSARLPALVGMRKAKELSYTARSVTGKEAAAIGLANRSVPLEQLDQAVTELIGALLPNSADSIAAYKALYNEGPLDPTTAAEESRTFQITDTEERLSQFR